MIAVYLLPVYLLVNGYLLHRIFTWLSAIHPVFRKKAVRIVLGIVYLFVAFSPGIGFLTPPGEAQRFLKGLGYYWMGIMLYMVLVVVAADLIRLVHTKIRKKTFPAASGSCRGALPDPHHSGQHLRDGECPVDPHNALSGKGGKTGRGSGLLKNRTGSGSSPWLQRGNRTDAADGG